MIRFGGRLGNWPSAIRGYRLLSNRRQDDFLADVRQCPGDRLQNGTQRVAFVVDGNHDGQQHGGACLLDDRLENSRWRV